MQHRTRFHRQNESRRLSLRARACEPSRETSSPESAPAVAASRSPATPRSATWSILGRPSPTLPISASIRPITGPTARGGPARGWRARGRSQASAPAGTPSARRPPPAATRSPARTQTRPRPPRRLSQRLVVNRRRTRIALGAVLGNFFHRPLVSTQPCVLRVHHKCAFLNRAGPPSVPFNPLNESRTKCLLLSPVLHIAG